MSSKKIEKAIGCMIEGAERTLHSQIDLARNARREGRDADAKAFNYYTIRTESYIEALKDVLVVLKGIK